MRNNVETVLMKAADIGDIQGVVETLRGFDGSKEALESYVNAQNDYGNTALMLAANHNHYTVTDTLLKAGALVNIVNSVGQDAVFFANRQNFTDIVELLVENGATRPTPVEVVPDVTTESVPLDNVSEVVDTSVTDTLISESTPDDNPS